MKTKKYLVIGVIGHEYDRYANEFVAKTPQEAEEKARQDVQGDTDPEGDLVIAGTIELKPGLVIEMAS